MKIIRCIYIIAGFLSFSLGTIGIFLPVLPTTPFYLLTAFLFAKGSPRFHRWFTETKLYKKHLADFVTHRSMSLQTKIGILIPASLCMIAAFFLVEILWVRILIVLMIIFKYYYFNFRIKTINKNQEMHTAEQE